MQIPPAFQVLEDRPLDFGCGGKSLAVEQLGLDPRRRRAKALILDVQNQATVTLSAFACSPCNPGVCMTK